MKNGKNTIKKPSLYIAMPCYDMVKINTMISMVKLIAQLTKAGIDVEVNTMKSPYISYARNILTGDFIVLTSTSMPALVSCAISFTIEIMVFILTMS